jgi:hypothetical protein
MFVAPMTTLVGLNPLDLLYYTFNVRTLLLIDHPMRSLTNIQS